MEQPRKAAQGKHNQPCRLEKDLMAMDPRTLTPYRVDMDSEMDDVTRNISAPRISILPPFSRMDACM